MHADAHTIAQNRVARRLTFGAVVLAVPLAILFTGWSGIDLDAARIFYVSQREFYGHAQRWSEPLRYAFQVFYAGCIALAVFGLVRTWRGALAFNRPRFTWLYLLACLFIGPVLVTHGLFKVTFGRPRPMEITEFGGVKNFRPAFVPSRQCA